jgi:uracil-DNA glycosylase
MVVALELLEKRMHPEWAKLLVSEFNQPYMINLINKLAEERNKYTIYPAKEDMWNILKYPPSHYKVIIIGQDPYVNGEADGFAFSCNKDYLNKIKQGELLSCPQSLAAILNEVNNTIYDNLPFEDLEDWNLKRWAEQGVCLMNKYWTVRQGQPNSHGGSDFGWINFTAKIISILNDHCKVALLWGSEAKTLEPLFKMPVLKAEHPVAHRYDNRKAWDCKDCFNEANKILISHNLKEIDW